MNESGTRFVSIKEAARRLGLSERYLRKAVDDREVPGFYTPKRFNVDMPEYEKVLEAGTIGRPEAERTPAFTEAVRSWKAGEITATEAMKRAGMKRTTFYKLVKQEE